jgi:hypothetical protein
MDNITSNEKESISEIDSILAKINVIKNENKN